MPDVKRADAVTVVYVLVHKGINPRVEALARLATPAIAVIFVTTRANETGPAGNLVVRPPRNPLGLFRKIRMRSLARWLESVFYVHGRHQLYVRRVVGRLRSMIEEDLSAGRRVTVLTCAPPHVLCLAGLRLKRCHPGIRWVIDWQDLWSSDETYFRRIFPLYRPFARRLERRLLFESDTNITTNERARDFLRERFGLIDHRLEVIGHHTDPEAENLEPWRECARGSGDAPRIVFMGRLFKGVKVPGGALLRALAAVRHNGPIRPELHLYGDQGPEFARYAGCSQEFGLRWHGSIERHRVVSELRKYDYLLLLLGDIPNSRLIMHLKLREYLIAGPPILAIVPADSAVADIIERTGTGVVIPADSDWAEGLTNALRAGAEGVMPTRVAGEIRRFSWEALSGRWKSALGIDV